MNTERIQQIDVRTLIEKGIEPFPAIIKARLSLNAGESLLLIAPFEPHPLYRVFEDAGYRFVAKQKGPEEWHVHFIPLDTTNNPEATINLDLRALEPPDPLHKTLEATARLQRGQTLCVRTRFRPVHLLETLEGSGFDWDSEEAGTFDWVTHIWRVPVNPKNE